MSKGYFSYVRVSTQRQGQQGTSLTEQTAAIERYAKTWNLEIVKRFEERETAAKTGRPVFLDMVKALKQGKARGVLIHKIDRSARNLRDWSKLGSLIDSGVEVHFANESLDLTSRGGRLSADIQAVVASDYVRNLREETIKGMRGRVKQGFYPLPAPLGYNDAGAAKAKTLDPVRGPLIKKAFELYAAGNHSLIALAEEMYSLGLRNRNGGKLSKNALNVCLRNQFYMGLVKLRSMAECFVGQHQPLVSKNLFDRVQRALDGKHVKKTITHFFLFRRHIMCGGCANVLVAERQKGHVYYRCHTRGCTQRPFREEIVIEAFCRTLKKIQFNDDEVRLFEMEIEKYNEEGPKQIERHRQELGVKEQLNASRLEKLADAYMDGVFDRETYALRKNSLMSERIELLQLTAELETNADQNTARLKDFLELAKSAYSSFKLANGEERRDLIEIVSSNVVADGENLIIKLKPLFDRVHDRTGGPSGGPFRDTSRTILALLRELKRFFDIQTTSERGLDNPRQPESLPNYRSSISI